MVRELLSSNQRRHLLAHWKQSTPLGKWLSQLDFVVLLGLFVLAVLAWTFAETADAIRDHDARDVDTLLMTWLREPGRPHDPAGPNWWTSLWMDITSLGSAAVVSVVYACVTGYLALAGRGRIALAVLGALLTAAAASYLLKAAFDRPRPEVLAHYVHVSSPSFPSGHSLSAAVAYPTLGAIVAELSRSRFQKVYALACSLGLMVLVGFSRVYLGVHYPTDVLAGWCVGLGCATISWLVVRRVARGQGQRQERLRGSTETP